MRKTAFASLIVVAALVATEGRALACENDSQCKGDRVCTNGQCVARTAGTAPPPASAPPTQPPPPPPAAPPLAEQACKTDVDCPGEEICNAGVCRAEEQAAQPPAAQPPPPGYYPPPPYYGPASGYDARPEELDYDEGDPIPAGYEQDTKIRKGLVIAGAVTFGTTWLFSVAGASILISARENCSGCFYSEGEAAVLYIPVFGPPIAIATLGADTAGATVLIVDGIAQAGGLTMLIVGLAARKNYLRRVGDGDWTVTPIAGAAMTGVSLSGSF
jgi:hypothetical protein